MIQRLSGLRREVRPMLALAVPVVVAEMGWVAMGTVDILMVGSLGPEAIGAVGVGSMLFIALAVFGVGVLLALDTFIAQAFGADQLDECHRWLVHGVVMSLMLAVPLTGVALIGISNLDLWGFDPTVLRLTAPYLRLITWSAWPLLLYVALRRYLQAMGVVTPIMVTLLTANLINIAANWVLIHGNLGAPALGVNGAGWATCISRIYMAMLLLGAVARHDARTGHGPRRASWAIERARLARLFWLGLPAACQVTLEVGVFSAATALAARLAPVALAAHQITLNMASFTFMVPLGMASAAAVRVGHAVGRRDADDAGRAGWTAVVLGVLFMAVSATAFLLLPRILMGLFTTDPTVIATGVTLLAVAAAFQLFDGLQGVLTGALRGLGDTRTPMLWNLVGHWAFGLPLGYTICFVWARGVVGLWIGLSAGLIVVSLVLLTVWRKRVARLRADLA
ncbi:MAG: MATE family efflux transporter [Vicinamibacterales bacterium]|jgi:MATE family multidrug resistance protein|nr:MATE family efflux transporter [Acidobacteriota bacterium]MDP7295018.1 MATE family efflux transporter [Vicinamibacterales bacterium]MDP7471417.1 MATE family efflux transporter [Vicinamibacterales bacterium]MDP7671149.1 MATE family efflux transporter [Vicinamibacterales bacterium]HJO39939.1 MATE family efflux transporter [Vicinamibacterales bacterium]|tara:strand:+ start:1602 stop:2957 length:1356 start_codon:yes stop_codon:yes gene_type:complete